MKIKQVLLASCLLLAAHAGMTQDVSPRDQFKVLASPSEISITKGSLDSVELTIVRAKHFRWVGQFGLGSPIPKGVSVIINAIAGKPDHFVMYLQADDSSDPGKFYLIPSYQVSGSPRKGVLVRVIVVEKPIIETK